MPWVRFVVVVVLLAGCGGAGDDASTTTSTSTTATTEAATTEPVVERDCPYVTAEVLADALVTTVEPISGSAASCAFWTGHDARLQVTRVELDVDPATALEQARSHCVPDTVVEVDAGDGAFACIGIGANGTVVVGDEVISLGATGAADDRVVRDAFVEVLPQVTT